MANRIVSVSALWLIALFSVGMLQQIYCETPEPEEATEEDQSEGLYEKLNKRRLTIEAVDGMLQKAPADEMLAGVRVGDLLLLKDLSNVDCSREGLAEFNYAVNVPLISANIGLEKYCKFHFLQRVILCVNNVVKEVDEKAKGEMAPIDREFLEKFYEYSLEARQLEEVIEDEKIQEGLVARKSAEKLKEWWTNEGHDDQDFDGQLKSRCTNLRSFLEQNDPLEQDKDLEDYYFKFTYEQDVAETTKPVSYGYHGIKWLCDYYEQSIAPKSGQGKPENGSGAIQELLYFFKQRINKNKQ